MLCVYTFSLFELGGDINPFEVVSESAESSFSPTEIFILREQAHFGICA